MSLTDLLHNAADNSSAADSRIEDQDGFGSLATVWAAARPAPPARTPVLNRQDDLNCVLYPPTMEDMLNCGQGSSRSF